MFASTMNYSKVAARALAPLGLIATLVSTACSTDNKNDESDFVNPTGGGGADAGNDDDGTETTSFNPQVAAATGVTVTIGNGTSGTTTGAGGAGGEEGGSNTLPPGFTAAE